MDPLLWVLIAIVVIKIVPKVWEKIRAGHEKRLERQREEEYRQKQRNAAALERKRQSTPCYYNEGVSFDEFERIVKKSAKILRRVSSVTITGAVVEGKFYSQSGISEWPFRIDF